MKAFIVSVILLLLITIAVILNSIYIQNITDDILHIINTLPSSTEFIDASEIDKLKSIWENHRNYISITINSDYVQEVTLSLDTLISYIEDESDVEYKSAVQRLRNAVLRIKETESVTIFNII